MELHQKALVPSVVQMALFERAEWLENLDKKKTQKHACHEEHTWVPCFL